jgi:hypothetical protein
MSGSPEQQRWEIVRRSLLNIVAQIRDMFPDGRYTLDIRIVEREQVARAPR